MAGQEILIVQGMPRSIVLKASETTRWHFTQFQDIGGNAFDGRVYAALLAAIFSHTPAGYIEEYYATDGLGFGLYNDLQDGCGALVSLPPSQDDVDPESPAKKGRA